MMKYLFLYPWIMAALVLGVAACLGMILQALFVQPQPTEAVLVLKELAHAPA